jgi:hypothetical protein
MDFGRFLQFLVPAYFCQGFRSCQPGGGGATGLSSEQSELCFWLLNFHRFLFVLRLVFQRASGALGSTPRLWLSSQKVLSMTVFGPLSVLSSIRLLPTSLISSGNPLTNTAQQCRHHHRAHRRSRPRRRPPPHQVRLLLFTKKFTTSPGIRSPLCSSHISRLHCPLFLFVYFRAGLWTQGLAGLAGQEPVKGCRRRSMAPPPAGHSCPPLAPPSPRLPGAGTMHRSTGMDPL